MTCEKIDFTDKVAVVTGSSRGIGKAIADKLLSLGAHVIYTGTTMAEEKTTEKTCLQLDLSKDESIKSFIKKVKDFKQIDILVNNAGINKIESVDEISEEKWEEIIKVNLTGPMVLTKEIAKIMKKNKGGGKILNISSIFGSVSKEKRNSYSASKFGLIGLTKASSIDLAPHNILVNALCPGFTLTDLTKSVLSKEDMEKLCEDIPLGRFAQEDEIAQSALFLCSDLNTYITGQTLIADGGFTSK